MARQRKLLRLIIPAYPEFNIYSAIAKRTTGLGMILVASAANKLPGWEVEIIDENNCGRRSWPGNAEDGYIDHRELQKQQPADIVGFYGSMSSCIPRLCELATLYKSLGAITVAGGYHARSLPQDLLKNGLDIIAMQDGEQAILGILRAFDDFIQTGDSVLSRVLLMHLHWRKIADVAFMDGGQMIKTGKYTPTEACAPWPLPDFSLLKYANIKTYPIQWRRGCPYQCEFCAVKERPESVTAEEFLARVRYLAEKFRARKFFIVDDHFGGSLNNPEDYAETMKLLQLLQAYQRQIGQRLSFTIQIRLNISEKSELLCAMRQAGIDNVCIGYESPIDADLVSMNKGYVATTMNRWTKLWKEAGFFVHGMFIFAYPANPEHDCQAEQDRNAPKLSVAEKAALYRRFIKKAKIDTAQILLAVPLPGTELRTRLEREGRLLDSIGWEYYDGQFPLYQPADATPEELQQAMHSIMGNFYSFHHLFHVICSLLFHFPRIVFPAAFTLFTFKVGRIKNAFRYWRRQYFRTEPIRFGGWFIIKNWDKQFKHGDFNQKLLQAQADLTKSKPPADAGRQGEN